MNALQVMRALQENFKSGKVLPCAGCGKRATGLWKSVNRLEPICDDCTYERLAIQNIVRIMEAAGVHPI